MNEKKVTWKQIVKVFFVSGFIAASGSLIKAGYKGWQQGWEDLWPEANPPYSEQVVNDYKWSLTYGARRMEIIDWGLNENNFPASYFKNKQYEYYQKVKQAVDEDDLLWAILWYVHSIRPYFNDDSLYQAATIGKLKYMLEYCSQFKSNSDYINNVGRLNFCSGAISHLLKIYLKQKDSKLLSIIDTAIQPTYQAIIANFNNKARRYSAEELIYIYIYIYHALYVEVIKLYLSQGAEICSLQLRSHVKQIIDITNQLRAIIDQTLKKAKPNPNSIDDYYHVGEQLEHLIKILNEYAKEKDCPIFEITQE